MELVRNFFGDGCEVSSSSSSNFDSVYDDNVRSGSESSASRFDELEKGKIRFLIQLSQGPGSKTIVMEEMTTFNTFYTVFDFILHK